MDYWRREQIGAATGIAAVVCFIVAGVLPGSYPGPDSTSQQIATFLADHRTALIWQTFLLGIGTVFGLWFLGSLRALLRRAEGGAGRVSAVAYAGGLLLFGVTLINQLFIIVPAYRPVGEFDLGLTKALYSISAMTNYLASFPMLILAGATTLVLVRTDVLPKLVSWLGVVAIAGAGLGAVTLFYDNSNLAVGSTAAFIVPFAALSVLILGTSIAMIPALGQQAGMTHMKRRVEDIWTPDERARRAAQGE